MSVIVGLDLSLTSTGYAYDVGEATPEYGRITTKKKGVERLATIVRAIDALLDKTKPQLAVVEGYAMGFSQRNSNTIFGIGELGGVVRLALYNRGISVLQVPPTNLKLFATGRGNASKDEVIDSVISSYGIHTASDDEADAITLMHMGLAYLNARMLPRRRDHYQRRAIESCKLIF